MNIETDFIEVLHANSGSNSSYELGNESEVFQSECLSSVVNATTSFPKSAAARQDLHLGLVLVFLFSLPLLLLPSLPRRPYFLFILCVSLLFLQFSHGSEQQQSPEPDLQPCKVFLEVVVLALNSQVFEGYRMNSSTSLLPFESRHYFPPSQLSLTAQFQPWPA